jgi:hypothetical protein
MRIHASRSGFTATETDASLWSWPIVARDARYLLRSNNVKPSIREAGITLYLQPMTTNMFSSVVAAFVVDSRRERELKMNWIKVRTVWGAMATACFLLQLPLTTKGDDGQQFKHAPKSTAESGNPERLTLEQAHARLQKLQEETERLEFEGHQ